MVDPPTLPSAPAYPLRAVNLSVGFALGVLTASAYIAIRSRGRLTVPGDSTLHN